jgi:DMSO/TMAO reductase YedYZ heme-binding membrane subunit
MKYLRPSIYAAGLVAALLALHHVSGFPDDVRDVRLTELYGFISAAFIYLALLCSPLYEVFPRLALRRGYMHARRALGVLGFCFAAAHAWLGFFRLLGGWAGLSFLTDRLYADVLLSALALVVLFAMAATSFDFAQRRMGRAWIRLHRFLYLAGVLVLLHLATAGSHFITRGWTSSIVAVLVMALLLLEGLRLDRRLALHFPGARWAPVFPALAAGAAIGYGALLWNPAGHAEHAASRIQASAEGYTATLALAGTPAPGEPAEVTLFVQGPGGAPVTDFDVISEKLVHLVGVSHDLTYFTHVHPDLRAGVFTGSVTLPRAGRFHLYADVKPRGAEELSFAFEVALPGNAEPLLADFSRLRTVDGYKVAVAADDNGLAFTVRDGGGRAVRLKPYLGALGHLVLIRTEDFSYVHLHPDSHEHAHSHATGRVGFKFHAPPHKGSYKAFFQFDAGDGAVRVAEFLLRL